MRTLPLVALFFALAATSTAALAQSATPAWWPDVPTASRPSHARRADKRDSVTVEVKVDRFGLVTSARVRAAAPTTLDSAAVDAARWGVFEPAKGADAARSVTVGIAAAADEPLRAIDDVVPQAVTAEKRGQWKAALDFWVAALGRVGTHPAYTNPWPFYERGALAARRLPKVLDLPVKYLRVMLRADGNAERAITTQANLDLMAQVAPVNEAAPWFARAWRVRACAAAGAGLGADAARSLRMWKIASPDSLTNARADSALVHLANGQLVVVNNELRR